MALIDIPLLIGLDCAVFATGEIFLREALVLHEFSVPMSRGYNDIWGAFMCVKRSVVLGGHKTSISVEDEFWVSLKAIAASQQTTLSALLTAIDCARDYNNLSSNIRLFVLNFYRERFEKQQTATITTHESPLSPLQ